MSDAGPFDAPFRALFELSPDAILVFAGGILTHANPAAVRLLGAARLDELVGRRSRDLIAPESLPLVAANAAALMAGTVASTWCEETYVRLDGSRVVVEATAARALYIDGKAFVVILRDISERKAAAAREAREQERRELERQLATSQRLEGIGRLAGGVAHDFNNLLTVILEGVDHLGGLVEGAEGDLARIRDAATRAATLTRGLLAFAREAPVQPKLWRVDELAQRMTTTLERIFGDDVRLETDLRAGGATAFLDAGQLDVALVNVALNARDAMPAGGTLTVTTRAVTEALRPGAEPAPCVAIELQDTGRGMDEATRRSAFEPFFTTKPAAVGSGLGLSTSYGIVAQLGGRIDLSSEPRRGTTVRIVIPCATADLRSAAAPAKGARESGTVLLVEDDPAVRRATSRMLQSVGYTVLVAQDAEEALRIARDHTGTIDVLLTDVVMPDMNGVEVARRFHDHRPAAGLVLMSGYSRDSLPRAEGLPVLHMGKPFTRGELVSALKTAIEARQP